MGLFSQPLSWTDHANDVPPERTTWVTELGGLSSRTGKGAKTAEVVDAAVADIEAAGWRLEQLVPLTRGASSSIGGEVTSSLLGFFRRV